jgi:hypothetical protein
MSICVVRAIRRARVSLEALLWTAMPRMQALGVGAWVPMQELLDAAPQKRSIWDVRHTSRMKGTRDDAALGHVHAVRTVGHWQGL